MRPSVVINGLFGCNLPVSIGHWAETTVDCRGKEDAFLRFGPCSVLDAEGVSKDGSTPEYMRNDGLVSHACGSEPSW